MHLFYRSLAIVIITLAALTSHAQKKIIKQGHRFYEKGKYLEALDLYGQLPAPDEKVLFLRGMSNYQLGRYTTALNDLSAAYRDGYREDDIYLYTAKCLHRLEKYEEAAVFYKNYLKYRNDDLRIVDEIKKVGYALSNKYAKRKAFVENLGNTINTVANEVRPIISPSSDEKIYFSSDRVGATGDMRNQKGLKDDIYGKYAYDMYCASVASGYWEMVDAISPTLNTPTNDILQTFSGRGQVLMYRCGTEKDVATLKVDTFRSDTEEMILPDVFASTMDGEKGDGDVTSFGDSLMIFSSNTLEGYGGYDLYYIYKKDSSWSEPNNMGSSVNTPFNERTPFVTYDGGSLYFASDRTEGYGGYDIFQTMYNGVQKEWSEPNNMGKPINSPADDLYYSLTKDNRTAYLYSDREGTIGRFDIFKALLKKPSPPRPQVFDLPPFVTDRIMLETLPPDSILTIASENDMEGTTAQPTLTKKQLHLKSLYYDANEEVLTSINRDILDKLADNLRIYPTLQVVLISHTYGEGEEEYNVYFSIKRAEKVADYLIQKGVSPSRIVSNGVGNYFPLASWNNKGASAVAERYNRRIDIKLVDPTDNFDITYESRNISTDFFDPSHKTYTSAYEGLYYLIKLRETSQMYSDDILRKRKIIVEKRPYDRGYTYYAGMYLRHNTARKVKNDLLRSGYNNAVIIPYINGQPLSEEEVESMKEKYRDLIQYQRYE